MRIPCKANAFCVCRTLRRNFKSAQDSKDLGLKMHYNLSVAGGDKDPRERQKQKDSMHTFELPMCHKIINRLRSDILGYLHCAPIDSDNENLVTTQSTISANQSIHISL